MLISYYMFKHEMKTILYTITRKSKSTQAHHMLVLLVMHDMYINVGKKINFYVRKLEN